MPCLMMCMYTCLDIILSRCLCDGIILRRIGGNLQIKTMAENWRDKVDIVTCVCQCLVAECVVIAVGAIH